MRNSPPIHSAPLGRLIVTMRPSGRIATLTHLGQGLLVSPSGILYGPEAVAAWRVAQPRGLSADSWWAIAHIALGAMVALSLTALAVVLW